MKNLKFSRLFAAFAFVAILALAGCKQPEEETHYAIEGTWVCDDGQKFIITNSTLSNYWGETVGYAGDNLTVVEISDTAGTIFIKYTKAFCSEHSDFDNFVYTYDEDAPDVGKWYAVSYQELTDESVKLSGSSKPASETLEQAKIDHTSEKGAFAQYDDFVRQ